MAAANPTPLTMTARPEDRCDEAHDVAVCATTPGDEGYHQLHIGLGAERWQDAYVPVATHEHWQQNQGFLLIKLAPGVWRLLQHLDSADVFRIYLFIIGVPDPAPWEDADG